VLEPTRLTRLLRLYEEITVIANDCEETGEALRRGLRAVCETTGFAVGHAFLVSDDRLVASGIWSLEDPEQFSTFQRVTEGLVFPIEPPDGPLRQCVASGRPRWFRDVTAEPGFQRARLATDLNVGSMMAFPVLVGDEVVAVIEFYDREVGEPVEELLDVMRHVGTQLGRVFERQSVKELERQALEAERRYLRIAAHEVRGPLATAGGFLELLISSEDLPDETRRDALRTAHRELLRLGTITRNFLVDARLHAGALRAHRERVEVSKVLVSALTDVPSIVAATDLICPQGLNFDVDPFLLRQAIVNLLTNAERYGAPPYRLEATRSDSVVDVVVRDAGPGVDPDFVPRLFERFARATDGGTGAGIGLEIVHSLVTLHGGSVRYEPCQPRGAAFVITLPQRAADEPADEPADPGGEAG
jgi:signal transduction histidine kinase